MSERQIEYQYLTDPSKITPQDMEDFSALRKELTSGSQTKADLEKIEWIIAHHILLVARENASTEHFAHAVIVGMGILIINYISQGRVARIEDVVVNPTYQGQEIGTNIMVMLIKEAAKQEAEHIDLTSRPARKAANKLYRKLGFQKRNSNDYRLPKSEFDLHRL